MQTYLKSTLIALLAITATAAAACTAEPIVFPTPLPTATPVTFPEPLPTATPITVPSPLPTSTPAPTATPVTFPEPLPTATPAPTATPVVFATPRPASTPAPTATPTIPRYPTPLPTSTPAPTTTPVPIPFADIGVYIRNRIVAIETEYRGTRHPVRRGVAWPAKAFDGQTCLVTSRSVAAAHTQKYNGEDVPITSTSKIISATPRHFGNTFRWVSANPQPLEETVILAPNQTIELPVWELAPENSDVKVGDEVMVISYDFLDESPSEQFVRHGIISHVRPATRTFPSLMRLDVDLDYGEWGAVIVNEKLQVVGMMTSDWGDGKGLALHVDEIRETLNNEWLQC